MNIAIIHLNAGRGSGEVSRQQARYLLSRGCTVYFMHPGKPVSPEGAEHVDIPLHAPLTPVHEYLPSAGEHQQQVGRMSYDTAMRYLEDYEKALEAVIDRVDIVFGHHANITAIATARACRKAGKPYALFLHGTGIEPRHHGLYDDRIWAMIEDAIRGADGGYVTTEYVRDCLVQPLLDLPLDRFLVLPCAIDIEAFNAADVPGIRRKYKLPERYVICPGALTAVKGPQNIVAASRAYADLAQTVFIGGGELHDEIERDLGERGSVLGFVPDEDKNALIKAASILTAAPEKLEHFGIIYAEALAAGTVPVSYEGGGVASVISEDTGILTERNPQALGAAIRGLLEAPDRLERMGSRGRRRAEEHFAWDRLGQVLLDWLAGLASG